MNRWNDVGEPPIDVHPRDSLSDRNGYRDGAARLARGTTDRFAHELTDRGGNPRSRGERKFKITAAFLKLRSLYRLDQSGELFKPIHTSHHIASWCCAHARCAAVNA
jgi:hypothetical protein